MELKECITCGSHSFTGNKCDYCGNEYELQKLYADDKLDKIRYIHRDIFWSNEIFTLPKEEIKEQTIEFQNTPAGKKTLKVMIWLLVAIIWFAVTVSIPPLFIFTICGLIIWVCRKVCKKY